MSFAWSDGHVGYYQQDYDIQCLSTVTSDGYNNWDFEEPNNSTTAVECAQLNGQGMWSDQDCSLFNNYICTKR